MSPVLLDLNVPLLGRLVTAPGDLRELSVRLRVVNVEGDLSGARIEVHRMGPDENGEQLSTLLSEVDAARAIRDGWLTIPALAAEARDRLAGKWRDHTLALALEGAQGKPAITLIGYSEWPKEEYLRAGDFRVRDLPQIRVTVVSHPKHDLFDWPVKPRPGVYCVAKDGRLNYGGERLRLWGVCRHYSHNPEQVLRIKRMGFNAVRLWGPVRVYTSESAKRGEFAPGAMDAYDRYYAEVKRQGMWVMCPTVQYRAGGLKDEAVREALLSDDSWLAGGEDWEEWKEAIRASGHNLKLFFYFDERLRKVFKRHAANFLHHRNPHTGKRYLEEEAIFLYELNNENGFLKFAIEDKHSKHWPPKTAMADWPEYFQRKLRAQWNAWLVDRYRGEAGLERAWGELAVAESLKEGTVAAGPIHADRAEYPEQRGRDFVRFCIETVDGFNQDIRAFCRGQAPEGVGVNVVPFSFDTQFRGNLPWLYADSRGDIMCFGTYINRMTPAVAAPPGIHNVDSMTVEGRPTVLYEVNAGRPNPYRTEYPMQLAALGGWQDFDGIFWHYMQEPGADWKQENTDENYLVEEVPYKSNAQTEDLWFETDPVMCTSLALAGQAFLNGAVDPAPDPIIHTAGADAIFGYDHFHGVPLAEQAFSRGARIRFEPGRDTGLVSPAGAAPSDKRPTGPVMPREDLRWDWPHGRLIIDTPTFKAYVGKVVPEFRFRDGVALSGVNTDFVTFAMSSVDGRALVGPDAAARIHVAAVFNAANAGFRMDTEGLPEAFTEKGQHGVGPSDKTRRILSKGRAPAVVDRVTYTVTFPVELNYRFEGYDFALRKRLDRVVSASAVLRHDGGGLYMGVLTIHGRGPIRGRRASGRRKLREAARLGG